MTIFSSAHVCGTDHRFEVSADSESTRVTIGTVYQSVTLDAAALRYAIAALDAHEASKAKKE